MEITQILLAATPVLMLIVLLGFLRLSGDKSAGITLLVTILIAIFGFNLSPLNAGLSFGFGALKAIFPIIIIIIMAIFSYNILVYTRKMEVLKMQFSSISADKSIQVLLLAWGFGGLLEGMAGFGTAVAIPAAILIGLGYKPVFSALVCLISNSVPTAFGAVGVPVKVVASEIGIDNLQRLSTQVVFQLSPLMIIIPIILVFLADTRRESILKNLLLGFLVGTVSLLAQYFSAKYLGPETPAILGSIAAIITIVLLARLFRQKKTSTDQLQKHSTIEIVKAWSVYGTILLLIFVTSPLFLSLREFLKQLMYTPVTIPIDGVDKVVKISWLTDAGTVLFLGSMIGGLIQGAKLKELFTVLGKSVIQLKKTQITIISLIALSTIMDVSGMIEVLGVAIASATGSFYPFFAPAIGCLGTFLTGSDTSSNILFGKLQASVAHKIGVEPSWLAAANTVGGTGGKIISPQSIAVATSACNMQGKEGDILKKSIPYALFYIVCVGIMVYFFGSFAVNL